jgi:hypothetical protein
MALNLPRSSEEAKEAARYPMDFYECCQCGHVFNTDFDYALVPYAEDSNLMYNSGAKWSTHVKAMARLFAKFIGHADGPIIDIGAGDGNFLHGFKEAGYNVGRECIAFEPGVEAATCRQKGLVAYDDYFVPRRDLYKFKPAALSCRHVLEHLQEPRDFIAEIAHHVNKADICPLMMVEVPCITKGLKENRVSDFLYEHVGNFTQRSLQVMFESAGWNTEYQTLAYNGEVAIWMGHPAINTTQRYADSFRDNNREAESNIRETIEVKRNSGNTIAYWGGTGKGASFLNAYGLTGDRVVDSDEAKVGRYVPGTGQEIEHSSSLLTDPVYTIVITTRWRAADIYTEIKRRGIECKEVLVLDGSELRMYGAREYEQESR